MKLEFQLNIFTAMRLCFVVTVVLPSIVESSLKIG